MTSYPPPREITDTFNVYDFTYQDEQGLTIYEGNLRYVKKAGDTVNGPIIFQAPNTYQSIQEYNDDVEINDASMKIYDNTNTLVGEFDNTGAITCSSINGINSTTLGYLDPTSSIQTQFNTQSSNIANNAWNIALNTANINTLQNKTSDMIAYNSGTLTSEFQNKVKATDLTFTNTLNGKSTTTFGYLDATSSIQTQFNNQSNTLATHTWDIALNGVNITTLQNKTSDMIAYNSGTSTSEFQHTVKADTFSFTTSINGITSTVFGYLSGLTSNVQTQLNNLSTSITNLLSSTNTWTGATNTFRNDVVLGNMMGKTIRVQTAKSSYCYIGEGQFSQTHIATDGSEATVVIGSCDNPLIDIGSGIASTTTISAGANSITTIGGGVGSTTTIDSAIVFNQNPQDSTGLRQYIPYVAKVSFYWDGVSEVILGTSYGVSSVDRAGTGIYTVYLSNTQPSNRYLAFASGYNAGTNTITIRIQKTTTVMVLQIRNTGGSFTDCDQYVDVVAIEN